MQDYHLKQKLIILFGEVSLRKKGVYVVQNGKENDSILGKGANERPRGFWVGAQYSLQNCVGDDEQEKVRTEEGELGMIRAVLPTPGREVIKNEIRICAEKTRRVRRSRKDVCSNSCKLATLSSLVLVQFMIACMSLK